MSAVYRSPERRKQSSDGQRPSVRIAGYVKSEGLAQITDGLWKPSGFKSSTDFSMGVAHRYAL